MTAYNRICPCCASRYIVDASVDGWIDIEACTPCRAQRTKVAQRRRLYLSLVKNGPNPRHEALLLALGGKLPGKFGTPLSDAARRSRNLQILTRRRQREREHAEAAHL